MCGQESLSFCCLDQSAHFLPQYEFICDTHNNLLVDRIIHYENLGEEFNSVLDLFGLPKDYGVENASQRVDRDNYMAQFTPELIQQVNAHYKKDFDLFGYPMADYLSASQSS